MNYIQYMKPGDKFNPSLWDFNKVDKSKLTPEQIRYAVELYFWRTRDPEMEKQYELWSDYQKRYNASLKADPMSDIAAAFELPEVTITMAKPNYIDLIKSDVRNKWNNMSTEDKVHAGIDAATTIGGFIPGVDVVADGADVLHSLQRKDWAGAGIGVAAMALPFVSAPMLRKIKNAASNTLFSPEARLARAMNKNIRSAKFTNIPIYHGLTSHLQGDDAAQMFNEYANGYTLPTTETENVRLLRAYVAEVRERYGLVGNDKVSDETILKALYKHVDELGGNTAARNIDGEPQLLFRGDTRSYTELKPRVSPEELITMGGTMDNSLGTLFLGELPGTGIKGQGLERYLVHGREFNGNKQLIGSGTGAHVVSPTSGDKISEFDAVASFPYGSRYLVTHTTSKGIPHSYYKLPAIYSSTGVNDINGFVVRTPNMRNASKEISVLNDDLLVQASSDKVSYYGPKIRVLLDKDGFPLLVDEYGNVVGDALAGSSERAAVAQHYRHVLDDAKLHNQGLLKSEGGGTNGIPGNYLRDEHSNFNYFALPNFNLQNAKHILPYDFRIPRDWSDPNIFKIAVPTVLTLGGTGTAAYNISNSQPLYQKQGGSIKNQKEKSRVLYSEL